MFFTATDVGSEFVSHNAELASPIREYIQIIYQETTGCDYIYSFYMYINLLSNVRIMSR